ncbi:MAG TPA: NAD(P)H-dependent oxidoreductase subunit E [Myxococcales bacterium]|jgi:NADH-quinone oxidoreductase E subunit|nr:NAD(P)H-dependent oxidoreductase subunit E [Myxococcales bacterium]
MVALSRQAEPVSSPFNPEQQRRFDEQFEKAIAKYPAERRRSALLAVMHLAQDELGWLSEPAMAYVGWRLDVPPVRVREVATFYTMYRLRPVGRHHIGVCNSISCWAMGSEKILHHCADRLGIRPGERTKDGQFSLEEISCLASCGTAPAILVNNFTYVENVTPESLDDLIRRLRDEPGQAMAPGPEPRHLEELHGVHKQSDPQATGTLGQPAATAIPADRRR